MSNWGYVKNLGSSFDGQVNGLRFFDRSLSSREIFDAASEAIQRLIIQLDESQDATESATALYQFPSSAPFYTTWIKLPKNSVPTEVNNPSSTNWSEIKATLGDGVVIELVGSGDGNTTNYTDQTTLSGYTPDELVLALKQILPGGLSAAEMFISATHFVDPNGYETADLSDEKELTPGTEPATLRFSTALMKADLTESVNYGPLKRFNADNDIEFKQTTEQWVLYEQVNENNPVILDYTHKQFGVATIISIGKKIYTLVDKSINIYQWKKSINEVIDSEVETSLSTFRQLDFDSIAEDTSVKANKPDSSETAKARRKTSKFYDIFRIDTAKAMKVFLKDADLLTTGMSLSNVGLQLATPDLVGAISGSGSSVADNLNKPSNKGSILFKNNKNKKFRTKLLKATKYGFKNGALTIVTGPLTVYGAVQLFKTGNTYDIVKGSLQIASGLVLPIVEVTTEALIVAEFTSSAAAGPFGLGVAVVSLVIDIGLMIADAIRKAIQRQKLARKASQFAADGFYDLITDLKGSLDNIDDLYISGAFSNVPVDSPQIVLTGITSWLYQALNSSLHTGESIESILGQLSPDDKNLSVDEFIQKLVNHGLDYAINQETANAFKAIYDRWTAQEEGVHPVIDIDLVSDSSQVFHDSNLIECLDQFFGERLDDGGTQSAESDAVFTAEEALTLDGSNLSEYSRNIAVYGVDADGLREEVQTGKGNDTIILGLGEFHIQTGEGNNTIYLSKEFKDVLDANDQNKYYLDAGDIEDASLLTQRQKDSDTLIINGSAHVNLTVMADKNKTSGGEAKQAVFFHKENDTPDQKPLLVSGLENVYGSHEDDQLISNAAKCSTLTANAGNNILVTGYGVATTEKTPDLINTLKGGTGNDTLYGSHAGGHGYNSMSGGNGGNNLIIADEGVNILHGGPGNDTLVAAIHPDKTTDNIFLFGFGDGNDCIEKGLNLIEVYPNSRDNFTDGIHFVYGSNDGNYNYPSNGAATINSANQVRDILQFGEGVSAANVRVSVGGDSEHTEPNGTTAIDQQVTFSLIVDDTRVFDALIDGDLTKPNLQTGDSITIKGNWSGDNNWSHRIKTLRFGDGSSLEIAKIDKWDTTGTVKDDNVTLPGSTFFQGFSGNDIITSNGYYNVILPGSGNNTVNINSQYDQILINRHPFNQDTITINGSDRYLTVVLDGSIRLRDLGFTLLEGVNLVLKVGNGGNLSTATQTIVINYAKNNLLLQFGTGFTLDLTKFDLTQVHQGDNENNTLTATGPAILSGGFGNDTLNGGATGPSIFIGGAGNDTINGSKDNSSDLYILEDRGGLERITGLDGTSIVSNKTVLIVSTNAEFLGSAVLKRDEIWFATKETVNKLPNDFDRDKLPDELKKLEDGQLLIWIRGQNNGAIITDWDKWDENTNRVVVTNQYEGAFEIKKAGINTLLEIMDKYQDVENKTYKPWHPVLNDEDETLKLNEELSDAILVSWKSTSSIISPGVSG